MAAAAVAAIEGGSVAGQEGAHTAGQGALSGVDQEMQVIGQERPGIEGERVGRNERFDPVEEVLPIVVIGQKHSYRSLTFISILRPPVFPLQGIYPLFYSARRSLKK